MDSIGRMNRPAAQCTLGILKYDMIVQIVIVMNKLRTEYLCCRMFDGRDRGFTNNQNKM